VADAGSRTVTPVGKGSMKAAALLLGLGRETAAHVFQLLGESEVRNIAVGAKQLRGGSPNAVSDSLRAFIEAMEGMGADVAVGDDLLRDAAARALGPDAARRAFDGISPPPPPDEVLGPISDADPEALGMVLSREQPQTVALVLSALSPEKAAAVMDYMPEAMRPQIVRRMATVDSVAPEMLREVRHALTHELQAVVAEGMRKMDGKGAALEILRRTPVEAQKEVLNSIEKDDAALAEELRTKLFTFTDLGLISDRDIQALIKDIELNQLSIALKGAGSDVKDKFLRNMSSRAAEMLNDDMAAMGPMKMAAVEEAQAGIAKVAMELSEKGKLTIVRPTDKML